MMRNVLLSWSAPPLPSGRTTNLLAGSGLWGGRRRASQGLITKAWTEWNKASSEKAVCSHHPKLSVEQLCLPPSAGGMLTPCLRSPTAHKRHSKWQEPKKRKVSGFKFSFYWRKEKKKEKNRLFCLSVRLFPSGRYSCCQFVSMS